MRKGALRDIYGYMMEKTALTGGGSVKAVLLFLAVNVDKAIEPFINEEYRRQAKYSACLLCAYPAQYAILQLFL